MRIGIDISQIAHEGTGVSVYVQHLVREIVRKNTTHTFVLFGASLRKRQVLHDFAQSLTSSRVQIVVVPIPPSLLDVLWNVLHIIPVEWFIGKVDVFWSSDWTQPPLARAKGITTIHDLTILRYPESFARSIVRVHKRKLARSLRICTLFLCDSKATQKDVIELLGVQSSRTRLIYPGFSL